jgi:tyrosine-protein phosphatase YwqE
MSLFKNIFGSKKIQLEDYSLLHTDVHSHLIPGIDDGSKSVEESIVLIRGLHEFGYKKLIITPHVMSDYYKNNPENINAGLDLLKDAVRIEGIDIELEAAAEYYADFQFLELINQGNLLQLGNGYVLFELSYNYPPNSIKDIVFKLQTAGYKTILAHPERYLYWHNDFSVYEQLKDRGVLFQANINSFSGHYSLPVKKVVEKLVQLDYIELVGTDLHNTIGLEAMHESLFNKYLCDLIKSGKLINSKL